MSFLVHTAAEKGKTRSTKNNISNRSGGELQFRLSAYKQLGAKFRIPLLIL